MSVMSLQNVAIKETPPIADPAPLGLAAFALTTFLLSAFNVGWTKGTVAFLGFALAYGGLAQLLAGMWEFRNRNVFGATAFSTYGAFWIGVAVYFFWVVPEFKPTALELSNDLGWISVAFVIFNTYMLLWSLFVNRAVFAVFLTLEVTFILLAIGHFSNSTNMVKAGGVAGIVTAACAWYASAAGVINGMASPEGPPGGQAVGPACRGVGNDQRAGVRAGRARKEAAVSETREEGLSALLHETRTFPPPEEFAKQANAQPGIYAEAESDPLAFWAAQAAAAHVGHPVDRRARVEPALRQVVRRRQTQRGGQLRRPPRCRRPGPPGRLPLGGRAGRHPDHHLRRPPDDGEPGRQRSHRARGAGRATRWPSTCR